MKRISIDFFCFSQQNYDKTFLSQVYTYPVVTFEELRRGNVVNKNEPVRIQYNTKDQYKRTAKLLGLMDDFKVCLSFAKKKKMIKITNKHRESILTHMTFS